MAAEHYEGARQKTSSYEAVRWWWAGAAHALKSIRCRFLGSPGIWV